MDFEIDKKRYLQELEKQESLHSKDKSKKGFVDAEAKEIIETINKNNNFYTTSSCAGRIILFQAASQKKCDNKWIIVSHKKIIVKDIITQLQEFITKDKEKGIIWLRYEPFILHICAKTIDDAEQFLNLARQIGFKRGGISSVKKRIMIEINGVDRLDVPIGKDNKIFADQKYLEFLLKEANKKLLTNLERIEKFMRLLEKI